MASSGHELAILGTVGWCIHQLSMPWMLASDVPSTISERELLDVHVVAELLGVLGVDLPVVGHLLHVLEFARQCLGLDVLHRIVDVAQGAEMRGEGRRVPVLLVTVVETGFPELGVELLDALVLLVALRYHLPGLGGHVGGGALDDVAELVGVALHHDDRGRLVHVAVCGSHLRRCLSGD